MTDKISQKIEKAKNDFLRKEFINCGKLSKEEVIIYAERSFAYVYCIIGNTVLC